MIVHAKAHWDGDESKYCQDLGIFAESQEEAALLAALLNFLRGGVVVKRLECLLDFTQHVIEQERVGEGIPF